MNLGEHRTNMNLHVVYCINVQYKATNKIIHLSRNETILGSLWR